MTDWSRCPDVESVPDRCGGAWVVKDTRVIVESCILGNAAAGCTPEIIAENFSVPLETVRRILRYARHRRSKRSTVLIGPDDPRWRDAPPGPLVRKLLKRLNADC
jgi:uncharacterized protein (DUF433 family)